MLFSVILHEILEKLRLEDKTLRTFRRALAFSQVIKKVSEVLVKIYLHFYLLSVLKTLF
jgi:hypothetical protein